MNMPIETLGLILLSVALSASAQIVLKVGMSGEAMSAALATHSPSAIILSIFAKPQILVGLACYVLSMAAWLFVLAKVDVSLAYPFVSVGFLITLTFGVLVLGESLSAMRVAGTLFVVLGVILAAQS